MMAFQCKWHKHRHRICTVIKQGDRNRYTNTHTHTYAHNLTNENCVLWRGLVLPQIIRRFILTLRRLQKWNSSFSAACRLMDSSESVNSVLNGTSTCVTYADWACVCECVCVCVCLYALPVVWVPLPQPLLTCPASSLIARLLHKQGGETARGWGRDEGGKGGGAGAGAADHASLPGNQECGGSFSRVQATSCLSYIKITGKTKAGVCFFFIWNMLYM